MKVVKVVIITSLLISVLILSYLKLCEVITLHLEEKYRTKAFLEIKENACSMEVIFLGEEECPAFRKSILKGEPGFYQILSFYKRDRIDIPFYRIGPVEEDECFYYRENILIWIKDKNGIAIDHLDISFHGQTAFCTTSQLTGELLLTDRDKMELMSFLIESDNDCLLDELNKAISNPFIYYQDQLR